MSKNKRVKDAQKSRVLSDHKKVEKRFIPPLLQLGPLGEIKWIDCILPELLWIGLLNEYYDLSKGAELGLSLVRAAVKTSDQTSKKGLLQ